MLTFAATRYMPMLLTLTLFIAVLLSLSRMYRDSEMVVWFASGLSLTRWITPILSVAIPLSLVVGTLSLLVSPWANEQMQEVRNRYEKREDIAKVSPGKFQESRGGGRVSFVEEVSGDLSKVQNIFTSMINDGRSSVIVAKEGKVEIDEHGDRFLVMSQGRRYDGLPTEGDFQMMQFEKYAVLLSTQSTLDANNKSAKALPSKTLIDDPSPVRDGELLLACSNVVGHTVLGLAAVWAGYSTAYLLWK